ncbi:MAG: hypothetical protein J7K54_00085 [Candidatus Aenigmarchaeota archaeon]|nr:hypothetical protein [Candidatus Aenigmarchaeota archaeon]
MIYPVNSILQHDFGSYKAGKDFLINTCHYTLCEVPGKKHAEVIKWVPSGNGRGKYVEFAVLNKDGRLDFDGAGSPEVFRARFGFREKHLSSL